MRLKLNDMMHVDPGDRRIKLVTYVDVMNCDDYFGRIALEYSVIFSSRKVNT